MPKMKNNQLPKLEDQSSYYMPAIYDVNICGNENGGIFIEQEVPDAPLNRIEIGSLDQAKFIVAAILKLSLSATWKPEEE